MELFIDDLGKVSITTEFYDENKDKSFSRHTIVHSVELGKSYISRRQVPVGVPLTDTRFWMPLTSIPEAIMLDYTTFKKNVDNKYDELEEYYKSHVEDLQQKLNSILLTSKFGVAISNRLGNDENVVVSQAALTRIINQLMNRVTDAIGELPDGVKIEITPDYVVNDTPSDVTITATAGDGVFEQIDVYVNGNLALTKENVTSFVDKLTIDGTSNIEVIVSLLGIEYKESKTITSYYPFFIGSGTTWTDVVKTENLRKYNGDIDGEYQIRIENQSDRMFVVVPVSIREQIQRLSMSGFEIPCDIITDDKYVIYQSRRTYRKGVFSININ